MNLEKSTKFIAKRAKKGFQGYPQITITYFGQLADIASEVVIAFMAEEEDVPQEQKLVSKENAKTDETIQTTLLKIIERSEAKTVIVVESIHIL